MPAVGQSELDVRPGAAVFGDVLSGTQACLGTSASMVTCSELGCVQCALIWKSVSCLANTTYDESDPEDRVIDLPGWARAHPVTPKRCV